MNARNRSLLNDTAPHAYDALLPRERQVLGLWDDGWSIDNIAMLLGLAPKTVKDITIAFDDRLDTGHEAMMRRGSDMLRARILQFHPHVCLGGRK